eukprot:Phypoly_transcript_23342.p1 GENE.Phypoly_transcript_23342~~Phypoly_transcript_23342.p1  ORF type:complete len:140 (+),score=10.09 Phypoly_transcript_23342:120-539(+)
MDDEVGYPPSTPDAVILPITQVLEGPHGGVHQVDTKYNEYLRHKISPEEFRVTVEYLNELLREMTYSFWPFFFMIVPVLGCLFACWLIRYRINERRRVLAEYLEYMNDHVYCQRGILWRAVEFSQFSWVEINLVELQGL